MSDTVNNLSRKSYVLTIHAGSGTFQSPWCLHTDAENRAGRVPVANNGHIKL